MKSIELDLPDEGIARTWTREAEKVLEPDILGDDSEVDPEMSVDLYILGGNRRVKTDRANRLRAHLDNPVLMAGFKDVSFDNYTDMLNETRRENGGKLRRLHDGLEDSLGDYQVFLEEFYDIVSDGRIDSHFVRTPRRLDGLEEGLEAAESAGRMMRENPDYEVKEVRFLGGVEERNMEQALELIDPAISFEITYSGDPEAFEQYVEYAEEHLGPPSDADGVPGSVYIGKEDYPAVVFNGPPYDTLRSEEVEKDIWERIEG